MYVSYIRRSGGGDSVLGERDWLDGDGKDWLDGDGRDWWVGVMEGMGIR